MEVMDDIKKFNVFVRREKLKIEVGFLFKLKVWLIVKRESKREKINVVVFLIVKEEKVVEGNEIVVLVIGLLFDVVE